MSQAILESPPDQQLPSQEIDFALLEAIESLQRKPKGKRPQQRAFSAKACLRAKRLLDTKIEFMPSPEFSLEDATKFICGPVPEIDAGKSSKKTFPKPPADTPPYLAALYSIPLLTREQEYHQFRKMNFLKFEANRLRDTLTPEAPDEVLMDEIDSLLARALHLRNEIVQANLRLVVSIAKMLVDPANSFDQMVSDGNVPLVRAVEIFDFERGTRFSTYATWAVRNSLYRSSVRNRRIRRRHQTGNEIAFETTQDHRQSRRGRESYHRDIKRCLDSMLSQLDERDRTVVLTRFGLNEHDQPLKFREIAEKLNISTERVRQLLARALKQLKQSSDQSPLESE